MKKARIICVIQKKAVPLRPILVKIIAAVVESVDTKDFDETFEFMSKRKWTDQDFVEAVRTSYSYAQVIEKLHLRVAGSNYDTVKRKIQELHLETSHMTGQGWNKGVRRKPLREPQPLYEILVEHSKFVNANHLRERLLREGVKPYQCECCGLTEWMGKPIALELHHINAIRDDQRLENLQLLCPNCHALTDNYRGKNKGKECSG